MNSQPSLASLVVALFDLARLGLPADVERLAGRLGIEPSRVTGALAELERRGLADARRVRLSLAGLALASQLDMERSARELFAIEPAAHGGSANEAPRARRAAA
ncbi:MAG: hypothetical protein U0353_24400 [Sandaracinus sp.]